MRVLLKKDKHVTQLPSMSRKSDAISHVLHSPGRALDQATRTNMEKRFHYDFSQVRVHDDAQAAESATSIAAHAYTVGNHIAFGAGRYAPGSDAGRRLLAHELTHVVQQHAARAPERLQPSWGPGSLTSEREADSASEAVTMGRPLPPVSRVSETHLQRSAIGTNERFLDLGDLDGGMDMCEHMACNDVNACQDDANGIQCPDGTNNAFKDTKHKWTRHLRCDPECSKQITPCSNDELVIALPSGRMDKPSDVKKKCGEKLTICANHNSVTATVREKSNKNSWEASGAVMRALGVKPDFKGSIYPEPNDPEMKDDRHCMAKEKPAEKPKDPPKKAPEEKKN